MAKLNGVPLDPNVRSNSGSFILLPPGEYEAVILSDEFKDNKANTGKYLELKLQIQTEDYKGVEIFDRLNLVHENQVTREIGQGTLRRICEITGNHYPLDDSRKLWGIPFSITVDIQEFTSNKNGNILSNNRVLRYDSINKSSAKNSGGW